MPLETIDSLVDALRGRPILRPEQFDELLRRHAPATTDTQELARILIRLRWITIYQAKKLIAGKADELVIGQYVILDKLGEGGMGKVYRAIQLNLNRVVALKIVRGNLLKSETALKRFVREVQAAAKLNHPNIVKVFDADHVGDRHFLAMEYIEGSDLSKLVRDRGPLPISTSCSYIRQTALGLQHANDRGMVHRDIKPSNLLVAINDKSQYTTRNVVKILDMGLAREQQDESGGEPVSTELTRTGTVIGTPDFMSPEQAKNSSLVDHRSDLYSLGCTFYYLLSGEVPFPNGNPLEKLLQHQLDPPRPIALVRLDVPAEVATIVHCLLAKKPEQRFQSGVALAHALEPWCSGAGQSAVNPRPVPNAEAVDHSSASLETMSSGDPFDFDSGDPVSPTATRRPPPLPREQAPRRSILPWVLALSAIFLVFLTVGAIGATILIRKAREKTEGDSVPPPALADAPKPDPPKPAPKPKSDAPPPKDLEVLEKYMPNDAGMVVVFDVKQWQSSLSARQAVLAPLADHLADFRRGTGVDLLNVVERVVIGTGADAKAGTVVVLQGRGLVTPRLIDAVKTLPGVQTQPVADGWSDLAVFAGDGSVGALYAAATETSVILSANRERVIEALAKQDGTKRTRFTDPTIGRGLEFAFARPFAAYVTIGLRQEWANIVPAASKLNFAAAGLYFDDRGMHFATLADETESGKATELQKAIGTFWTTIAKAANPPDLRIERLARLVLDAESPRFVLPKNRYFQHHLFIPKAKLDEWFAPFFPKET